jgi:hypothetical protein
MALVQPLPSDKASRNQVFLAPELQSPVTFQVPLASRKNRDRFILRICASEDHDAGIVQAEARLRTRTRPEAGVLKPLPENRAPSVRALETTTMSSVIQSTS